MKKNIFEIPVQKGGEKIKITRVYIAIGICTILVIATFFININSAKEEQKEKTISASSFLETIEEAEKVGNTPQEKEKSVLEQINTQTNNPLIEEDKNEKKQYLYTKSEDLVYEENYKKNIERVERINEELRRREKAPMILNRSENYKEIKSNENSIASGNNNKIEIPPFPEMPQADPNQYKSKKDFLLKTTNNDFVLRENLTPAISKYEIKAGTIIPLILETEINSDLPGYITALVKRDVYDSATGNVLLIPAGSKVIGEYNNEVSFGQQRVQMVFNRITFPNMKSISLQKMIGVDKLGASGVKDKVDTKAVKFSQSILFSVLIGWAGGALKSNTNESWLNEGINEGGTNAINIANKYAEKLLDVQPSLQIRSGTTLGIFVDKDIVLEEYE